MIKYKYLIYRIMYIYNDRPTKTIKTKLRTDNIDDIRELAKEWQPNAKIRFCYIEFN